MGRQEPATNPPLLDNKYTSARKRARRMYHRVMSGLQKGRCQSRLRLLTLTTATLDRNETFQRDFRCLSMRLKRRGLFLDYIRCAEYTESGLRHEHILFRGSYIEQQFLSKLWENIHGAKVVDIRFAHSKERLANYLANYLAKDSAGRLAYSWGWLWRGFAGSWALIKRIAYRDNIDFSVVLTFWHYCCNLVWKPDDYLRYCEGGISHGT